MIELFLTTVGLIIWIGAILSGTYLIMEYEGAGRVLGVFIIFIWLLFTVGFAINLDKNSPPCLKYETQFMYNAATKTMMPAQFCSVEGEWVNND